MTFDIESFKLKNIPVGKINRRNVTLLKGQFLSGPLPLSWLDPIFKKDTHLTSLCLSIWHLYNLNKKPDLFKFTYSMALRFGLKRITAWRGLKRLTELNLIEIREQKHGSAPIISIVFINCEKKI